MASTKSNTKVIYRGPEDEGDPTSVFEVPTDEAGEPNVRLPVDAVVEVDAAVGKELLSGDSERFAGHVFEAAPADAEPAVQPTVDPAAAVGGNAAGTGAATPAG